MINKTMVVFAGTLTALISSSAVSEPSNLTTDSVGRYYAGIQASNLDDGASDNSVLTWVGRFGRNINKYFTFEGRIGFPTEASETYPEPNWDKSLGVDKLYGLYGVGHSKIGETLFAYGLIGYTRVEATSTAYGRDAKSVDDSGLSFGLGLNKTIGNDWTLGIEYIRYLNDADFDINGTAIGAAYYF